MKIKKEDEYDNSNYIQVGYGSFGHNAHASNFKIPDNKTEKLYYDTIDQLKNLMTKMYPNWETINIEIKEKKSNELRLQEKKEQLLEESLKVWNELEYELEEWNNWSLIETYLEEWASKNFNPQILYDMIKLTVPEYRKTDNMFDDIYTRITELYIIDLMEV